ncbi:unnamed protein product [Acanthoscelides obtectus]|uniref:Uncharacterized protein n=1 Tax=Acanthoscelides obtectus TaxID=200917 RepID=A0A9P0K221_ACAOB|nr:unnamed protein product [Acanthoscelides obtectus]CAK1658468.1 hypothetical protein AOBTE_LOCUS20917 [Acanthoscelides obtectus]
MRQRVMVQCPIEMENLAELGPVIAESVTVRQTSD